MDTTQAQEVAAPSDAAIAAMAADDDRNAQAAATAPKVEQAAPQDVYVLDTTATIVNDEKNPRKHELIIDGVARAFKFVHGAPTRLPAHIAIKFLRHDGFKLTDEHGNRLEYKHRPKQPEELEAGEQFKLGEDEVVARYDELSLKALFRRAVELPGGEQFAGKDARPEPATLIAFIKKMRKQIAEANKEKAPQRGEGVELADADGAAGGDDADFT